MSTKLPHTKPPLVWIIIWVLIYAVIITVGLTTPNSPILTLIKVGGILLCSIYALVIFPRDRLLQLAVIVTFIADCILAKNNVSPTGLTVFFCAQLIHLFRLVKPEKQIRVFWLALIGMIIIGLNFWLLVFPPVYVICTFYALTLISNIITSWRWRRSSPHNFYANCAFTGFILFACCDLCTGLSYLSLISVLPAGFYAPANFFAWFFYYPSQVLISNGSKLPVKTS